MTTTTTTFDLDWAGDRFTYTITIATDGSLPNRVLDAVHAAITRALGDTLRDTPVSYDVSTGRQSDD
jgi:hypothetical protein